MNTRNAKENANYSIFLFEGKMAEEGLNDEYHCGYCYKKSNCMTEPKILPCSHIYCLTCLLGAYDDHQKVNCPECE